MKKKSGFKGKHHTWGSKRLMSLNNPNKLTDETIKNRIVDVVDDDQSRGVWSRLAKKWGVSHTQAIRWTKQNWMQIEGERMKRKYL